MNTNAIILKVAALLGVTLHQNGGIVYFPVRDTPTVLARLEELKARADQLDALDALEVVP